MPNIKSPKIPIKYYCKQCDYNTCNKKDFSKHNLTRKHQLLINPKEKIPKSQQTHTCALCNKIYKHASSLCTHRKHCTGLSESDTIDNFEPSTINSQTIMDILKQNQDFKELMVEQNRQIHETHIHLQNTRNENMELHKQLISAVSDNKPGYGNIVNNTTNNNNQKFNLNFFLNTTCKDAINMTEFIQNMEVQMSELENIGHRGYVAGMTDLILNKLKGLDVSKRPMHCTDLKRETMYIKDQDRWDKDNTDKSQLRKAISLVAKKNYGKTIEWREHNPECLEIGSEKYDFCFNMMRNVLGDFEEEQIKLDNKVIKNLAKEVIVDRDTAN